MHIHHPFFLGRGIQSSLAAGNYGGKQRTAPLVLDLFCNSVIHIFLQIPVTLMTHKQTLQLHQNVFSFILSNSSRTELPPALV